VLTLTRVGEVKTLDLLERRVEGQKCGGLLDPGGKGLEVLGAGAS
jgi:hypothetical protein